MSSTVHELTVFLQIGYPSLLTNFRLMSYAVFPPDTLLASHSVSVSSNWWAVVAYNLISTGDDPKFRDLCERATAEIFKGRFIRVFPAFLRP